MLENIPCVLTNEEGHLVALQGIVHERAQRVLRKKGMFSHFESTFSTIAIKENKFEQQEIMHGKVNNIHEIRGLKKVRPTKTFS